MVSPDYKSEIFARLVLGPGSSPAGTLKGNKVILQNENILMIKMINYFTEEPQPVHVGGFKININGMISFYIQYNFVFISIHHLNRPKTHKKSFASVKLAPTC